MAKADKEAEVAKDPSAASGMEKSDVETKLVASMLAARVTDIKPQFDFTVELGFVYPIAEQTLNLKGKEALSVLESLTAKGVLRRSFFDRLLRCTICQSVNLRPSVHCPKCGSGNVARGRILEHSACKYVGLEDEFFVKGRYTCPKCKLELRTLGVDYQSQGVLRKCRDCGEVFNMPLLKWRCIKCSSLLEEDKLEELNVYSYSLDEARRNWLEFEIRPKAKFLEFLKKRGYEVKENARVKGRSGAEHSLDILATRDDGVVIHNIAIGIEIAREKIGLERVLDFDVKAYDSGIHDKVLIVIPALGEEAEKFARHQRIKVLEPQDLEIMLAGSPQPSRETVREPFEFESKSQLIQYLEKQGYKVKENAEVKGRSGAVHNIDILATREEGIITHRIAIGIEVGERALKLDKVFAFDDKAYDAGIMDKVFIAVPGLSKEAMQFATRQGIKVFEVSQL